MNNYDICIIGAGPCGLTIALQLCQKYKICIIEAGRELEKRVCLLDINKKCNENCNPCNIITGFGGCQFIDGTKACFYPSSSGICNFGRRNQIINYYDDIEKLLNQFGKPIRKNPNEALKENLIKQFNDINIDVKYYNAQKVNRYNMKAIGLNIRQELDKNNVDIFYNEYVYNIEKNNKFTVITKGKRIMAKKVVIATGRFGNLFLNKLSSKLGIEYEKTNFSAEIGIVLEMPHSVFKNVDNVFNDLKLKRKIDDNNEVRTFCQNYKGIVRKCVFDTDNGKMSSLDGCILGQENINTDSINIAIHHRKQNFSNINHFKNLILKANKNNKTIAQNLKSFINNDDDNCEFNKHYCTMNDYILDNSNKYLPKDSLKYIKQMIIDVDKVLPGFACGENIVYSPSFELGGDNYKLNNYFETNIDGLYIGGDATGYFRGIMQAMISGKIISEDIIKKDGGLR